MIKNYIFDFGNVLANFYEEQLTEPYVQDAETLKAVSEVAFDRAYWSRLDDGSITDEEVKAEIRSRLPGELGELACRAYDGWIKTLTPVAGMQALISDMKAAGRRLYLLSNISVGFAEGYGEVPWLAELLGQFDGLVFSGPIALVKPQREIYEYLLDTYSLRGEECLFVDDRQENLDGAKVVGIQGYLFDGDVKKLREYLGI